MAVEVKAPNGDVVEFPDGTPDDVINSEMAKAYKSGEFQSSGKEWQEVGRSKDGSVSVEMELPKAKGDFGLGLATGAKKPITNAATWVENALDSVGVDTDAIEQGASRLSGGLISSKGANEIKAEEEAYLDQQRMQGRKPGMIGEMIGSTATAAPLIAGAMPAAPAWLTAVMGNAAFGALNSEAKDAKGVALDSAVSAGVGKAGETATKMVGAVVSPHVRSAVQRLIKAGVPVTPGQILGGTSARVEEAIGSIPFVGDFVGAAHRRGHEGFMKAAANQALAELNPHAPPVVPKNVAAGHDTIDYVQREFDKLYGQLVPHLDGAGDDPFRIAVRDIFDGAKDLGTDQGKALRKLVNQEMLPLWQKGAAPTGEQFKDLETILGNEARKFARSINPHDHDLANQIRALQTEIRELLARNNPAQSEILRRINAGYSKLMRVEEASAAADVRERGMFHAGQLNQAAKKMESSRRTKARGDAPMQALAADGGEVLSKKLPDSGTATRAAVTVGGGAALFGKTIASTINPLGVAGLGAILGSYTQAGVKAWEKILASRQGPTYRMIRQAIDNRAKDVGETSAVAISARNNEKKREARAPR